MLVLLPQSWRRPANEGNCVYCSWESARREGRKLFDGHLEIVAFPVEWTTMSRADDRIEEVIASLRGVTHEHRGSVALFIPPQDGTPGPRATCELVMETWGVAIAPVGHHEALTHDDHLDARLSEPLREHLLSHGFGFFDAPDDEDSPPDHDHRRPLLTHPARGPGGLRGPGAWAWGNGRLVLLPFDGLIRAPEEVLSLVAVADAACDWAHTEEGGNLPNRPPSGQRRSPVQIICEYESLEHPTDGPRTSGEARGKIRRSDREEIPFKMRIERFADLVILAQDGRVAWSKTGSHSADRARKLRNRMEAKLRDYGITTERVAADGGYGLTLDPTSVEILFTSAGRMANANRIVAHYRRMNRYGQG